MAQKVIAAGESAVDTNQKMAAGLERVQAQLDKIQGQPVTIAAFQDGDELRGYPAQYRADRDAPITEKARLWRKTRESAGGDVAAVMPAQPQVMMTFGQDDMEAMRAKENMLEQAKFDEWVGYR